jgi:RHH-type rel operon transcriptional repressor/antitoxin RelB
MVTPMGAADTAIVTVRLNGGLKAKLEALARSTRRSRSCLAAEAIAAYVELNEWQIGEIEAGIAELDGGQVVSEEEAKELYEGLLKRR